GQKVIQSENLASTSQVIGIRVALNMMGGLRAKRPHCTKLRDLFKHVKLDFHLDTFRHETPKPIIDSCRHGHPTSSSKHPLDPFKHESF
ncbi:hypothetical protein KI387_001206, partial [Taxus chinensis]